MFKLTTAQENHFQLLTIVTDYKLLIKIIFAEESQTEEIRKITHKTDAADEIVRINRMEIIIQDQTQIEVI